MSLTKAEKEEATRHVHATHKRIVTESDPEPTRRRPSGIAFRDTSSVLKKISSDPSQNLNGIQTLTTEEQLAANTMQALKASILSSTSQPHNGGSSEGTGITPGVPDESTIILTTSHEGIGIKAGVPDEVQGSSAAKADVTFDWGSENKSDYSEDDQVIDEEIRWVSTDEDEEKKEDCDADDDKNDEVAETRKGDEEITDTAKADAEKTEEVKDDNKKAELPPLSSSLSVSLDAEINSLLDIQIQQEILHIQSSSILTVPVSVIYEPIILSPIPEILTETPATTLLPPPSVTTIIPVQVDSKDVIEESVQENVINEVKNIMPKFLPKACADFATPVIQSTIKRALEKTPIILDQSSSQAQSSLKASELLSEYELKTIVFRKMDKSHSYLTHDKHRALFNALMNSLFLDDVVARGQADLEKILRKRDRDGDDKDEDPSVGPNLGKKIKRRSKESESSKKSSTTKETFKGNAPTKCSKSDKSVHAEESVVEPTEEVIKDTSNDYVVNDADQPQNDPAPKHNWLTQPPRPPTPDLEWNKGKAVDDSQEHTWFNDLLSAKKGPLTFDELMASL
ncbi:hypothetical protein Tco_0933134 [Tanacetum coccineum]